MKYDTLFKISFVILLILVIAMFVNVVIYPFSAWIVRSIFVLMVIDILTVVFSLSKLQDQDK